MNAHNEYRPIDCGVHDRLESYATLGSVCSVSFVDSAGSERSTSGRIVDVFARDGAEYLRLEDGTEVRLDRLRTVQPT